MTPDINCGHLRLHYEEGRDVAWMSAICLIVEPYDDGSSEGWVWQALPLFSGSHLFVDPESAANNMLMFMEAHLGELEAVFGKVVGLGVQDDT